MIVPCRFCQSHRVQVVDTPWEETLQVSCMRCGAAGPFASTPGEAWRLWNAGQILHAHQRPAPTIQDEASIESSR